MNYYAVFQGRSKGIFLSWEECKKNVKGFPNARYKKFKDIKSATHYVSTGGSGNTLELDNSDKTSIKSNKSKNLNDLRSFFTINHKDGQNQKVIDSSFNNELISNKIYKKTIEIYTDGSLIKNAKGTFCGYGVYIPSKKYKKSARLKPTIEYPKKTNNRAELTAIIKALQLFSPEKHKKTLFKIYTDSSYSILIFTKTGDKYERQKYKTSGGKYVKNHDLVKIVQKLKSIYRFELVHVRSHTGAQDRHSKGNAVADELAVLGAKKDISK